MSDLNKKIKAYCSRIIKNSKTTPAADAVARTVYHMILQAEDPETVKRAQYKRMADIRQEQRIEESD